MPSDDTATTICVIEAGLTPPPITDAHGDFPAMIERWLRPALPAANFATISPIRGDALPENASLRHAYVITGSEHSVYERLPWMEEIKAFIRTAATAGAPMFGICFGHQIMAEAFGGRVRKAEHGWQCGLYDYRLRPNPLLPGVQALPVLALHQDQVIDLPPDATLIGGCETAPYAVLQYGPTAASIQAHPEFDGRTVKSYLDLGKLGVPEEQAASVGETVSHVPSNHVVAAAVARLFRASVRAA